MTAESADALILTPLLDLPGEALGSAQSRWRKMLSDTIYGPLPPPPDRLQISRHALAGERAEKVTIRVTVADCTFTVDAALWLPDKPGPCPLIAGLDFIGHAEIQTGNAIPLDPQAHVTPRPDYGAHDGRLPPVLPPVLPFSPLASQRQAACGSGHLRRYAPQRHDLPRIVTFVDPSTSGDRVTPHRR